MWYIEEVCIKLYWFTSWTVPKQVYLATNHCCLVRPAAQLDWAGLNCGSTSVNCEPPQSVNDTLIGSRQLQLS